jgi:hypoxia up-regulated 1
MASKRQIPSLMTLLGAVFLLSTNVLAAAAVLGVDLGTEYLKAALVKPGIPLEIVLTKDSRRKETSAVAFKPSPGGAKEGQFPERAYGADAMALAARFPGEVYPNLKTLLGLPVADPITAEYAARHPALQLQEHGTRGTASFKTKTLTAEEEAWMVEELLAMELQSVQKSAEATAGDGTSVRSIVLTVPPFYTTEEKRAVQLAAELANLKVLSLISDGMAVGLNYATSRQFPNINEGAKPEYHMVFDMGAGSASATVLKFQSRTVKDVGKFNKTVQEVQSLGSGWDRTLGGDALNYLILDDMVSQFVESKGAKKVSATSEGVRAHGRAIAKLSKEAERVRHVLSANQNTGASFEGLYEDVDFKYKISRAEFEAMAEAHAKRVGAVINDALKMSGLDIGDVDSVILYGGATRTPFVQKALEQVVGSADKLRSNVNSDEAAVFGAGFRAAELSPSFRVKEIRVAEGSMYPAGIKWTGANGKAQRQRLWTSISPVGAVPKEMTFTDLNDFAGSFYQQIGETDKDVASFATKNLTATAAALKEKYPSCADSEVVFKMALKLNSENGEASVAKAVVECEAEVKEGFVDGVKNLFGFGKKDQQPLNEDEKTDDAKPEEGTKDESEESSATSSSAGSETTAESKDGKDANATAEDTQTTEKKKEIVSIPVEIEVTKAGIPQLSKDEMAKSKDRLKAFAASDKARVLREEALNQLEGFTYKIRDFLDNEDFIAKSTEAERKVLGEKSSEASDWLYEGGIDATKDELKAKLKALQDLVQPIQQRVEEAVLRPEAVSKLKDGLTQTKSFFENIYNQIDEYEQYQASVSSSSSSTTTSSAAAESSTGDFDGLEDDDATVETKEEEEDKEPEGPLPPLYKREEVAEIEKLHKETEEWLADMEAKQEKLEATVKPVLLSSDLTAAREKLEKAGMELAMKGIRYFDQNSKKGKKGTKSKSSKSKKTSGAKEDDIDADKKPLTEEELEAMLEELKKRGDAQEDNADGEKAKDSKAKDKKSKSKGKSKGKGKGKDKSKKDKKKEGDEETKHDEL